MKLINNQTTRLFDELTPLLQQGSEVCISASYFSLIAIYALSDELKKVRSIKILLDTSLNEDLRFAYDPAEWNQYHDLKGKHKAATALSIIQSRCSIRQGNVGLQKFILVRNGSQTLYLMMVNGPDPS